MLRVFLLIIVGLAGDAEHRELFHKWGALLAETAEKSGLPRERVVYLADQMEGETRQNGPATRESIEKAVAGISKAAAPEDVVFVALIGHGSFDGRIAKFNLPGPDMAASDFAGLLKRLPTKQVVFVNTASSSGPFVPELSGPGRTIITATRNGAEQFDTLFGGFFIDAFGAPDTSDSDKNGRVSLLEAFTYAKTEVAKTYEREGLLATEHALLDDDGNKEGSQAPSPTGADGKVASMLTLGTAGEADTLPTDPELRALYVERRALERRVEALRLLKASMEPARYESELEKLVTDLALKTREIRQVEEKR
jgi:hypothetical protein